MVSTLIIWLNFHIQKRDPKNKFSTTLHIKNQTDRLHQLISEYPVQGNLNSAGNPDQTYYSL